MLTTQPNAGHHHLAAIAGILVGQERNSAVLAKSISIFRTTRPRGMPVGEIRWHPVFLVGGLMRTRIPAFDVKLLLCPGQLCTKTAQLAVGGSDLLSQRLYLGADAGHGDEGERRVVGLDGDVALVVSPGCPAFR